jgi:hypothetical protein
MLSAVEDENPMTYGPPAVDTRALGQLESLLLLLSETNYQAFSLMSEPTQKSLLSLAYDLSARVGATTH